MFLVGGPHFPVDMVNISKLQGSRPRTAQRVLGSGFRVWEFVKTIVAWTTLSPAISICPRVPLGPILGKLLNPNLTPRIPNPETRILTPHHVS